MSQRYYREKDGRIRFFENESSVTPPFANVLQRGPPTSRREGILSRTIDGHFSQKCPYISERYVAQLGVKATTRAKGLAPVFISLIYSQ